MILQVKDELGNWTEIPAIVGAPGYTPQRGIDYWTETDKQEIVDDVLAALPAAEVISV